jgi:predicted Zn-dependent protease
MSLNRLPFRVAKALLLFSLWILTVNAHGQFDSMFHPMQRFTPKDVYLLDGIRNHLKREWNSYEKVRTSFYAQDLRKFQHEQFTLQVRGEWFLQNDSLQTFLDAIIKRVVTSNSLKNDDRLVLILNSSEATAYCAAEGLYVVSIALLANCETEDELAFVLSHEIAHDELKHLKKNTERNITLYESSKDNTGALEERILKLRETVYNVRAYRRSDEVQADSFGIILTKRAGYQPHYAVDALDHLDSAFYPRYDWQENFFSPFNFASYPFQDYWLKKRLKIFSKKPEDTFLFQIDSLRTHPEVTLRIKTMQPYLTGSDKKNGKALSSHFRNKMQFQVADAAFRSKYYDRSLFHVLQLIKIFPKNQYLISSATRMFINIYQAKDENSTLPHFIDYSPVGYSDRLSEVNSFLFHLTKEETSEIAFRFINNQNNFNDNNESHYYLLWQLATVTYRNSLKGKIEDAYSKKFGKRINTFEFK